MLWKNWHYGIEDCRMVWAAITGVVLEGDGEVFFFQEELFFSSFRCNVRYPRIIT